MDLLIYSRYKLLTWGIFCFCFFNWIVITFRQGRCFPISFKTHHSYTLTIDTYYVTILGLCGYCDITPTPQDFWISLRLSCSGDSGLITKNPWAQNLWRGYFGPSSSIQSSPPRGVVSLQSVLTPKLSNIKGTEKLELYCFPTLKTRNYLALKIRLIHTKQDPII